MSKKKPARHITGKPVTHRQSAADRRYWLTIATDAKDEAHARERARVAALQVDGSIVDVQPEPPQGATTVGDLHEDELPDR